MYIIDADGVLRMPSNMSFVDAAAIPVQFATAFHCLYETGPLRPNTRVLIHAAAGGVGQAAIQVSTSIALSNYDRMNQTIVID